MELRFKLIRAEISAEIDKISDPGAILCCISWNLSNVRGFRGFLDAKQMFVVFLAAFGACQGFFIAFLFSPNLSDRLTSVFFKYHF